MNPAFARAYNEFLSSIMQKPGKITIEDKMILVYYLQLQDRTDEAIKLFKTIKASEVTTTLKV